MSPAGTAPVLAKIARRYELVKNQGLAVAQSPELSELIIQLTQTCLDFLSSGCEQVPLISKVPDKQYFSFKLTGTSNKISRPVNRELFNPGFRTALKNLQKAELTRLSLRERMSFLYTVAMGYCCATDLLKTGDQKTPATFFECLIRHLLARAFGINPRTQVEVLRLEEEGTTLPTDLIFDLGGPRPKFHVPVKISTRERVISSFRASESAGWRSRIQPV